MSSQVSGVHNSSAMMYIRKATEKASDAAQWCGHKVSIAGSYLKAGFMKVVNYISNFIKNIPAYLRSAFAYGKQGFQYIKEHKGPVGVGAGITVLVGVIAYGIYSYVNNE